MSDSRSTFQSVRTLVDETSFLKPQEPNDVMYRYCLVNVSRLPFYEEIFLEALKNQRRKIDELVVPDWLDDINHDSAITRKAKEKKNKLDMRFTEKTIDSIKLRDKTRQVLDKMEYDESYNGVKSLTERKLDRLKHKIEYFGCKLENLTIEFNRQEEKLKLELSQELIFYEHILRWKRPKGPSITGDSVTNEIEDVMSTNQTNDDNNDPRELLLLLPKKYQKKIIKSEPYCHTARAFNDLESRIVVLESDMQRYRREYYKLIDKFKIDRIDNLRDSEINLKLRRKQSAIWQCLHPLLDFELNIEEVEYALKLINQNLINEREFEYIKFILDLPGYHRINFKLFCLIASLSEKVSQLEFLVKDLINKLNFEALEVKIQKSKDLFYLLHNSAESIPNGYVTENAIRIELAAGGLTKEEIEFCLKKLTREKGPFIDFLEFLLYIPLFIKIHELIIDNPINFVAKNSI